MSRTEQMSTNALIAAWRTVVPGVLPEHITKLIEEITLSQERFVIVSSSMFNETKKETKEVKEAEEADDEFVRVVVLSDNDIIALVNGLSITWDGLPHFASAWDLFQQNPHETPIQFALRKLSALRAPLIQGDPKHPLNDWHCQHKSPADLLDVALADAAYFHDRENNCLVIRHAVVDMSDELFSSHYHAIMEQVRDHILQHLSLALHAIEIKHVIPCIERGNLSNHIVLGLCDESYDPDNTNRTIVMQRKIDSRISLNDLFSTSPTRQSVKVQNLWDNVNCGRFVAVLCVIAAKVLSEHPESTCNSLTPAVFWQFPALTEAKNQPIFGLKNGLHSLIKTPYTLDQSTDHQAAACSHIVGLLSSFTFMGKGLPPRGVGSTLDTTPSATAFAPQ